MNVLSMFDGISCGQVALNRVGIKVENYFASEIDRNSIAITQKNYPNTKQIGDVSKIDNEFLKSLPKIDLVLFGSPCTGFSVVGNKLNFEDKQSKLFFESLRILEWIKNNNNKNVLFLMENVKMKDEWSSIITEKLGVDYKEFNSGYVSAQNRKRYYWTNIITNGTPCTNGCFDVLFDIMEESVDEKYFYKEEFTMHSGKDVIATLHINGHDILKRVSSPFSKCPTLTAVCGGNQHKKVLDKGRPRKLTPLEYERLQTLPDGYTEGFSDSVRYKAIGNGWTIDVISWMFEFLKGEK